MRVDICFILLQNYSALCWLDIGTVVLTGRGIQMITATQQRTQVLNSVLSAPVGGGEPKQAALRELCQGLVRGYSISQLLAEAVRLVSAALGVHYCAIFEFLPERRALLLRDAIGWSGKVVGNLSCCVDEDQYLSLIVGSREPVFVNFVRDAGLRAPSFLLDADTVNALTVTIAGARSTYAVLGVFAKESRRFGKEEIHFVQTLADLLAVAWNHEHTAEALRESELHYRLMVEGSEQVFFYSHDSDHIMQYASPSLFSVLGYTPEEVVGHRAEEFLAQDPINEVAIELTDAALQDGVRRQPYVAICRHKNGHRIVLETIETPISKDGIIIGMHGFARDVTAHVHAQRCLLERTAYLNALIEHNPLGIVVLDLEHRVKMCNQAFESLFQYTRDEIIGTNLDNTIAHPEGAAEAVRLTGRVLAGEAVHTTMQRRRKDDSLIEVELHSVPLVVDNEQIGAFAIYQDVTERKQAEESLRQLSARLFHLQDEERRRIARELHDSTAQLLAALTMNLGALSQSTVDKLDDAAHKKISGSLCLAEQCAREVRTLSYLLHPPSLDEYGLSSALRCYATGFSSRSGIKVSVEIAPELGRLAREVELALFRIVQESLTNVHRHSRSSTATIRLQLDSDVLMLEVRDNGRGISRSRVAGSRQWGVGITGMRERVQQLGGRLEISSRKGTIIRAILPLGKTA